MSPGRFLERVERLLADGALRRRLSGAARATAATELSPGRFLERVERLLAAG
ncbi:hypothetical protein Salmuc_05190 [Salipiger mucosus DSM 16094]|uniref:Uncharacterized protein n=1 Tax=Salipiger mucosus DSM 16094 TaxID=1123237 RepID=S9QT83_9RHOB|nr:hypothetical protein Salmuc_05190 [Salipiger mucosus DSM 16094]